jgi:hypothetical protein
MRQRFEDQVDRVRKASVLARETFERGVSREVRIVLADVRLAMANLSRSIETDEHRKQLRRLKRKHDRFLRFVARTDRAIHH